MLQFVIYLQDLRGLRYVKNFETTQTKPPLSYPFLECQQPAKKDHLGNFKTQIMVHRYDFWLCCGCIYGDMNESSLCR